MSLSGKFSMEQWVLAGALLVGGVLCAVQAFFLPSPDAGSVLQQGKMVEAYDDSLLIAARETWGDNPPLEAGEHRVYVSRLVVYKPEDNSVEYLDPESSLQGIRVSWLIANGFSLKDPEVPELDADQDGFNTREEFEAETDPRDAGSRPPIIRKLCIRDYEYIPFRLIFRGYSPNADGNMIYQINLRDVPSRRSRLLSEGDEVEGYRIAEFRKKIVERENPNTGIIEKIDESELDIINLKLNETITLVLNQEQESDESRVVFRLDIPGMEPEPASVQRGDTFMVGKDQYQLTKAGAEQSTIMKTDDQTEVVVDQCNDPVELETPSFLME